MRDPAAAALIALLLPAFAAARNLTVYHVNPLHEGVVPIDMDTADVRGDAFFDLRSKVFPIECRANSSHAWGGDCVNQEVVDDDLVVTKLTLQLRDRHSLGKYGRCNVCGADGVDPFSGLKCTPSEYICSCGTFWDPQDCTDQRAVGAQDISKAFGRWAQFSCTWERWIKRPWSCWSWPIVGKTGGMWYSTTQAGYCGAPGADEKTCTWDAVVEKVVNKSCSDGVIYDAIEAYDHSPAGSQCFERCPSRVWHPLRRQRNTSDVCWIYCFYQTIIGASAMLPSGGQLGGMPLEQITAAFEKPFASVADGGCPPLAPPPPHASLRAERARRRRPAPEPPTTWLRAAIADAAYRGVAEAEREAAAQGGVGARGAAGVAAMVEAWGPTSGWGAAEAAPR